MSIPVSIRDHNPGAMWGGAIADKFGSTGAENLNDGLGQGNNAARFPDDIHGAAAQFYLLQYAYTGMTVRDAIAKWAGRNSVPSYLEVIRSRTGLEGDDRLTRAYLSDPKKGVAFAQAMAYQEAGCEYPMSTADWRKAHAMVFGETLMVGAPEEHRPATLGERILVRAKTHLGESENSAGGQADIVQWAHNLGRNDIEKADFAWCADFTGAMCALEGAQVPPADDALLARSYLNCGTVVSDTSDIQPGDIAIWPRAGGMGHVNIVESYDEHMHTVVCIGGNQGNGVVSRAAPRDVEQALGFRRPVPSKLRPNGTKSFKDTVGDSPSLKMMLQAKLAGGVGLVVTFWNNIVSGVDSMLGILPTAQSQVSSVLDPATDLAQHAGIPLGAKVCFVVVAVILVGLLIRGWQQRKRVDGPVAQTLPKIPAGTEPLVRDYPDAGEPNSGGMVPALSIAQVQ